MRSGETWRLSHWLIFTFVALSFLSYWTFSSSSSSTLSFISLSSCSRPWMSHAYTAISIQFSHFSKNQKIIFIIYYNYTWFVVACYSEMVKILLSLAFSLHPYFSVTAGKKDTRQWRVWYYEAVSLCNVYWGGVIRQPPVFGVALWTYALITLHTKKAYERTPKHATPSCILYNMPYAIQTELEWQNDSAIVSSWV